MTPQDIEELSWRMGEVYEAVVNRILVNLARHFRFIEAGEIPSGAWEYQVKKLAEMGQINRETERIILEMLGDADSALQALLEESILNGLRDAEPALRSAAEKGFLSGGSNIPPVLAPNQMQAFKAFYAQSADKLNLVNTVMLESTQAAFAATVSDIAVKIANTQGILNVASGEVVTGVSAWNKAMRDAVNKMVDNGLTGYIDHAGRHWSPEAYVTMDIRSTMANTARAAVFERNEEYGNDLYQVSWHNGARPLCYPWQGKVISRTGNARMVEDDEGNEVQVHTEDEIESFNYGGGLFGVNCGHYPIPFIPNFSRIRSPQENFEENQKTYEESQKQRALERKLRNEKRDLEVLKARGVPEEEIKAQRAKVRKASKDIDEFCAETGRSRRRNRERTPVNATFPDGTTNAKSAKIIRTPNEEGTDILSGIYDRHTAENGLTRTPFEQANTLSFTVGADYKNVSDETARVFNGTIANLSKTYDTPLQKIVTMDSTESLMRKNTFASVHHVLETDYAEMKINPLKCKDIGKMTERVFELSQKGYVIKMNAKNASAYVPTHEFAHSLLNLNQPMKQSFVGADTMKYFNAQSEIFDIWDRYKSEIGALQSAWKKAEFDYISGTGTRETALSAKAALDAVKISDYSLSNADEFMAESFTNSVLGSERKEYADAVMNVINKYFKR